MVEEPQQVVQSHGDDEQRLSFVELGQRMPSQTFALPIRGAAELPLSSLEPSVLERLVAEIVYRHDHRGVQFYGRSGQAQYGLDIVEARPDGGYTLYQVKRYQELTEGKLRRAVTDYAGEPRSLGHGLPPRRFGADRFIVVTSAALDADTANVDALAALRAEYKDDLDIDAWGSEALSRELRELGRVVHTVFGEAWAKEFCAFEMSAAEAAHPKALGLVEHPASVLGLDTMLAEAEAAEPEQAAVLYRAIAQDLDLNRFPGHAAVMRRREANAALLAGQSHAALEALWPAAVQSVERGERLSGVEALKKAAEAGGVLATRVGLLMHADQWRDGGIDLGEVVPPLEELAEVQDPELPLLACLTLERALVDGLSEFDPPLSVVVETDSSTPSLLSRLVSVARDGVGAAAHPTLKARLACAIADAALLASSSAAEVDAQYTPLLTAAAAGRYRDASGLVAARAARASALHGDPSTAGELWRRAVLNSSEAGLYGDARAALRSMTLLDAENGTLTWRDLSQVVEAMPNRRRLIGGGRDPMLYALTEAHADRLPDAFGHARQALLVARTSGDLSGELSAVDLFGDVLAAAKHPADAVECWVVAGQSKKASETAADMAERADVSRWLNLPWRRRSDAAAQVVGQQADLVPDADAPALIEELLKASHGLWDASTTSPQPELSAFNALGRFASRLSSGAVERLLALSGPAVAAPKGIGADVARLLFRIYWAQPEHRDLLAPEMIQMMGQARPPHNIWDLARQMAGAHEPLLHGVRTLSEAGRAQALLTLADWREADAYVQQAARRACSALLRRPIVGAPNQGSITTQDWATIRLLLALLEVSGPVDFPAETFSEARAWNPGGVIMSVAMVADEAAPEAPEPDASVDSIAELCAGPPAALADAVSRHLLDTAEDRTGLALVRVQPMQALAVLIDRLKPTTAAEMVPRLLAIHRDPGLTDHDQSQIESDVPLSRFRFGGGPVDLAPAALLAAARALHRAVSDGAKDDSIRAGAAAAVAAALPLMQSVRHASWAAEVVHVIASADLGQENAALLLATHDKPAVRQYGALSLPGASGLLSALATDESAAVRTVVAGRSSELDEESLETLRHDPDRRVRTALNEA